MKELPNKLQLDIMWAVATSTSIETGTPTPKMGGTTPIMSISETDQ